MPLAAKELGVSQQAATTMIDEFSSNLRELTGRRRYRAWAVMQDYIGCLNVNGVEKSIAAASAQGSWSLSDRIKFFTRS